MSKFALTSSPGFRIGTVAMTWLVLITMLHLTLNKEAKTASRVVMGYMPVVTNLAAPLVDYVTRGDDLYFEARKFASFAEMGEAFRSGHIQAAFIIAPLAIRLFEQGVPLKIVYIGNRHESTLVMRAGERCESPADLIGKKIAVPIRYSSHFLALKRYMRTNGLEESQVRILEIPPPEMPAALSSSEIDGYFVGEPFACKSMVSGTGKRFLNVESIWPKFICNLLIVREELIDSHPEWVRKLVSLAAKSCLWAQDHMEDTVKIVSSYWGQDPGFVQYVFANPPGRFRFDLYVPIAEELNEMIREMSLEGLAGKELDARWMVDDHFAGEALKGSAPPFKDIFSIKLNTATAFHAQEKK
jgi:NitT/TauT family transport system substrate-binding protein